LFSYRLGGSQHFSDQWISIQAVSLSTPLQKQKLETGKLEMVLGDPGLVCIGKYLTCCLMKGIPELNDEKKLFLVIYFLLKRVIVLMVS
jgi:hypothetical protein